MNLSTTALAAGTFRGSSAKVISVPSPVDPVKTETSLYSTEKYPDQKARSAQSECAQRRSRQAIDPAQYFGGKCHHSGEKADKEIGHIVIKGGH
jgi:hypothetical protein